MIDEAVSRCLGLDALHVAHFSKGVSVPRPSGKRSYVLQVAPLPEHNEFGAPSAAAAIVFLTDPEAETGLDAELLKRLYRLTPAEIRLVAFLFSGSTVVEAAARLGISTYTARTHLKRIFLKLGVSRQPELMRLLAALASTTTR
jgi:DNA-binding CsgD family transcriptional regulator